MDHKVTKAVVHSLKELDLDTSDECGRGGCTGKTISLSEAYFGYQGAIEVIAYLLDHENHRPFKDLLIDYEQLEEKDE